MTWSGRPHIDATAGGAILLSTAPTSPERGPSELVGVAHGPCCLAPGGVSGGSWAGTTDAVAFSGIMGLWGGCGRLSAPFTLSLTNDVNCPEASDKLSNTISAPQFLHLSSRCNNIQL